MYNAVKAMVAKELDMA